MDEGQRRKLWQQMRGQINNSTAAFEAFVARIDAREHSNPAPKLECSCDDYAYPDRKGGCRGFCKHVLAVILYARWDLPQAATEGVYELSEDPEREREAKNRRTRLEKAREFLREGRVRQLSRTAWEVNGHKVTAPKLEKKGNNGHDGAWIP
jgi:hypothetical protein